MNIQETYIPSIKPLLCRRIRGESFSNQKLANTTNKGYLAHVISLELWMEPNTNWWNVSNIQHATLSIFVKTWKSYKAKGKGN